MIKGNQIENTTESDLKTILISIDRINHGFSILKNQFSRNNNIKKKYLMAYSLQGTIKRKK